MIALLLPTAFAQTFGLVVAETPLVTAQGSEVLAAGTLVKLVKRRVEVVEETGDSGRWVHRVWLDGREGLVSSADVALPVDALSLAHFGFLEQQLMRADLTGGGTANRLWVGTTEQTELVEGEPGRPSVRSWMVAELGQKTSAVALHDDNGWGTTATLKELVVEDLRGDGRSELRMRFEATVTEVGQGSDEVVVVGLLGGKLRTLLRLEVGNAMRNGLTQYRWGSVEAKEHALEHDQVELLTECAAPGLCVHRTRTTWRWSEDHGAFVGRPWSTSLGASSGGVLGLAAEPGGRPVRSVTEDLDRLTVLKVSGDPQSEHHLLIRAGFFGSPGWVPWGAVELEVDYLDFTPQ